jgi:ATP-dependent Zn protease
MEGGCAEEISLEEMTTVAKNHIKRAAEMARRMV